ncbi:MAG: type III-B CRISPR module RAMP protein Cmr1 [Candidatus Cloacimonetes bacterium]|nr:type III-B CRISPR module RAMP protein Cmr1 [Candidatus Cloacimonadota bacterium]
MERVIFKCEVITPMFLAGADGKTPELRPPSIKGALRFWWRALYGNLSLKELKETEADIFGGSEKSEGKSLVIIGIKKTLKEKFFFSPVPHKGTSNIEAFCPGGNQEFELYLGLRNNYQIDNRTFNLEKLKTLFILFSILGGLGKRTRRGFGCFRIKEIDNAPFTFEFSEDNILKLIKSVNPEFAWHSIFTNSNYPYLMEVKIGDGTPEYSELLTRIGRATHKPLDKNDGSLGYALGQNRFSSPIYVTTMFNENLYYPIISILNAIDAKGKNLNNTEFQKDFISEVLHNEK